MTDVETFGAVLAEVLAEFEAEHGVATLVDDAVQRLSLAAHHTVLAQTGKQLPRAGLHAYVETDVRRPVKVRSMLDVRY